ncbi:hypothetical protein LTS18_001602, partial [Coniosporium uncinatum]
ENSLEQTTHIMKYIFPRQFGLHNVFTSQLDSRETAQPFKDYTLREQEIAQIHFHRKAQTGNGKTSTPRRLRGEAVLLIQTLRRRHRQCAYVELLR